MNDKLFSSAVNNLTAWYVGALLLVCLFFSIPIYAVASDQLERGAERQYEIIKELRGPFSAAFLPQIQELRQEQLNKDRIRLLRSIAMADLTILLAGAYMSYWFAKRTLQPISEAHQAQARFSTDASHELRTPLATMQAEIEVALRNKKMTAAQAKQVLASNLEEIARLRSLSDNLLNLTRLGSNGLNQKTINLSKVIAGSIRQSEQQYGLKIAADIQKDITAKGDADLLGQLASILTDNAVKYAGNKPPDIHMQVYKRDKNAVLKITDKGIGIKPTELPYIFDRFYRGTNATGHSVSGHGLGLGLAKQIVEAHHGKIAAVSKNGQTTFTVSLPGV